MKSNLALRHQVGSLLIVGLESTSLSELELAWLHAIQPSGIILFRRNIENPAQIHSLFRQASVALERSFFRCVDLEGGIVDRLRDLVGPTPSVADVVATGDKKIFRAHGAWIGQMLHALDFNVNLAPVLDLALPKALPVMKSRVASPDPDRVSAYATEFLAGLAQHGVLGCGKHFPGLGGGALDSHHATPKIARTWEQLWREDIEPYRALSSRLPIVMVNHAAYPKIESPARPASFSRFWIQEVLRGKLRYRGLVLSDDMEMGGVLNYAPLEEAAIEAILAGTDLLEICHRPDRIIAAHEALLREAEKSPAFRRRIVATSAHILRAKQRHVTKDLRSQSLSAVGLEKLRESQKRFREKVASAQVKGIA